MVLGNFEDQTIMVSTNRKEIDRDVLRTRSAFLKDSHTPIPTGVRGNSGDGSERRADDFDFPGGEVRQGTLLHGEIAARIFFERNAA